MNDNNAIFKSELTKILIAQKAISEDEAKAIAIAFDKYPRDEFDEFLIDEGLIDKFDLLRALGQYYQVPSCDVLGIFVDTQLLRKFPKGFLLRNAILPIDVDGNIIIVVASNPGDSELLVKIGQHVSYDIQFQVGLRGDITDAVKEFYDESDTEIAGTELDPENINVHHEDIDQSIDEIQVEVDENISPK